MINPITSISEEKLYVLADQLLINTNQKAYCYECAPNYHLEKTQLVYF